MRDNDSFLLSSGFFNFFFVFVFVAILCMWGFYAYVGVTAVKGVNDFCKGKNVAQCAGRFVKDFNEETKTKDAE